jgi:hypothetical protein
MSEETTKIEPMALSELKGIVAKLNHLHVAVPGGWVLTCAIEMLERCVQNIEDAKKRTTDEKFLHEVGWDR